MITRNWSIRSKITAMVAVPLAALLALWIFATVLAVGPALHLLSVRTLLDDVGRPGEALIAELQRERRLSMVHVARRGDERELTAQRAGTDRAIGAFRGTATGDRAHDAAADLLRSRIGEVLTAAEGLPSGRGYIDRREVDKTGTHNFYSGIIDTIYRMFSATATYDEPRIDRGTRALTTIGRAREWLSRADSLLAGAHAAGTFAGDEHGRLIQAIGTQQYLYAEAVADLPQAERVSYQRLTGSDSFVRLQALQKELVQSGAAGAAPPVRADAWQPAYDSVVQQLRAFELNATDSLAARARPVAVGIFVRLALAGLLGLVAVVLALMVSVRVGRSLIGRLTRLRATLDAAGEQLPSLVRRLRRGESVDVGAESPAVDYGNDEIGRLGHAFGQVRRVAVQSAVDEAGVRRGLNEVFLNIARRSQTLLHRQLSLLDRMERRETEPQELEDLYRVDHLATRMRRHAEDLVILAGAAPGRGWRNPVPVVDVVRGAISEVEDYKRIDVSGVETAGLVGRAVGDVIHLLAELLENATSFSPPNTRVQVAGQVVPNGYAIEVEDRGLGMTPEALADVNRRLLEPPEFDPADSARLGLFVVAKLAGRHRIRVQLRPSPYGGVTSVALIPGDLVTDGPGPVALPAGPAPPDRSWDHPAGAATGGNGRRDERVVAPLRRSPAARRPTDSADQAAATPVAAPAAPAVPVFGVISVTPAAGRPTGGADATVAVPPVAASTVDGMTAEGLARRRRIVPLRRPDPPAPDADAPTLTGMSVVVPAPRTTPEAVRSGLPQSGLPQSGPSPAGEPELPRRVRQASLSPRLRRPSEPESEPSARSPDEVRRLMSALQLGTTRGRLAAARPPSPAEHSAEAPRAAPHRDRSAGPTAERSWAVGVADGYPVTRDAAGASADAATVVHYGEIVPRGAADAGGAPPSRPLHLPDDPHGDVTPSEKDA